jgi:hypothetical protein
LTAAPNAGLPKACFINLKVSLIFTGLRQALPLYAIRTPLLMRKYLMLIPFVLLLAYWVYRYFENRHKISDLHYGTKANLLRERLHVPLIDDDMKPDNYNEAISGLRWKAKKELPSGSEVLHVWKNAVPFSDKAGLYEEMDAFRKRYNDSLYYQLNINSVIIGDTAAKRSGKLFYFDRVGLLDQDLTDHQVDSVAKSWGMVDLVRRR